MAESSTPENVPAPEDASAPESAPTPEKVSAPENPELSSLNERLDGAQGTLDAMQRRLTRASRITAVVAAILLLFLITYFSVGYTKIAGALKDPELIVSLAGQTAEDYLPELRRTLEEEIEKSAPEWAKQVSDEVVASAPMLREELEDYALTQTDLLIKDLSGITEKEFKKFLIESRPALEKSLRELSSADGASEKTIGELRAALDDQLQANTKEQADVLLHTLFAMKAKLQRLEAGRNLNGEEALERRALMIVRRMQLEQADPGFKGKKASIGSKGGVMPQIEEPADEPTDEPMPGAGKEAEPKEDTPTPEAKEKAEPKPDSPAPKTKEEAKPKADAPAPKAKEKPKPKAETPAPEAEKAKPDEEKADKPESKPKPETESKPDAPKEKTE